MIYFNFSPVLVDMISVEAWVDLVKGELKDLLYNCEMQHAAYQKFMTTMFSIEEKAPERPASLTSPQIATLQSAAAPYSRACGDLEKIRMDGWDLRSAVLDNPDFLTYEEYLADVRCLKKRFAAAVERHSLQNLDLSFLEEVKTNMTKVWENRYIWPLSSYSTENREELNFIRKAQFSPQSAYLHL